MIMFGKQTAAILRWFIVCTILTSVSSINLSHSTLKPKHTKYSPSSPAPAIESLVTPSSVHPTPAVGVELYRAETSNGATCILLQADGLVEVSFKSHIGDETYDTYMPSNPTIEANCLGENTATLTLSWRGYSLFWAFEKTSGGERWYINKLELTLPQFHSMKLQFPGDTFKLVHDQTLFSTPVGKSYTCEESIVQLVPPHPKSSPTGLHATLFLREFQLQPFIYRGSTFGPPFECNAQLDFNRFVPTSQQQSEYITDDTTAIAIGSTLATYPTSQQQSEYINQDITPFQRDDTTPIAVGCTLTIAVLMTVTGYGIFRYFKIKKVQYKTVESPTRLFFITNACAR